MTISSETTPLLSRKSTSQLNDVFDGFEHKQLRKGWAITNFLRDFRILWPFILPPKSKSIQLRFVVCILLLAAGRVVNLFVPIYTKYAVDELTPTKTSDQVKWPWQVIAVWGVLRLCQGRGATGGFLNIAQNFLWISAQQFTSREVQSVLFQKLHRMSLRWHLSRHTGAVLRVMDRGVVSMSKLVKMLLFQVIPVLADIVIAVIHFAVSFNYIFAIICGVTMSLYIFTTVYLTECRTRQGRSMNKYDNEKTATAIDSLLNFETVKYFGNEDFELERFLKPLLTFQTVQFRSRDLKYMADVFQTTIITAGSVIGCLVCAYFYMAQLYTSLNGIGAVYATIQQHFINMENMVDLMQQPIEINDVQNAVPLKLKNGKLEFRNVSFSYTPEKIILDNLSFSLDAGETVAFVGPSGGGKSTIIRLLFRFYEPNTGEIFIDDQNIATVQKNSLREHIGVVPQDTVLFNDTIRYNINYGRPAAEFYDTQAAAKAADIHARIQTFSQQYDTVVGERGLKLSGGEKQRVAIARAFLKAPAIVLLDEATSALDTNTERNIQSSLQRVCKGRTTIIVAHRLSTIVDCDKIFVLQSGRIVERGTHAELITMSGVYAGMWGEQTKTNEVVD